MKLIINTDGGARGNPGPAGIGVVIKLQKNQSDIQKIEEISEYVGETTNNQAEYQALIKALEYLFEKKEIFIESDGEISVECRLDSELVVKQLNGEYKMKNEGLKPLFDKVKKLLSNIDKKVEFVHVYREENKEADRLVNEAIDRVMS